MACSINLASPSFIEIEFTIHFPCTHFNPASMISNFELSIIMGIFAMSGSLCTRFRKVVIASTPSNNASSIFTSSTCAPFSTCCRATLNASSYLFSLIRRANILEPVTLVRSPTFTKLVSGLTTNGSNPESLKYGLITTVSCIYEFFFVNNFLINEKLFTTSIRMANIKSSWAVVMLTLFLLPVIVLV